MCASKPDLIRWHLSHGADPNIIDFRAQDPCIYAAYAGNLESVKALMEGGCSVAETRGLIGAAMAKEFSFEIAEYLLGLGVDIDRLERDEDDEGLPRDVGKAAFGTALHRAVESEDLERVKFFLQQGADPTVKGLRPQSLTAIELAELYDLPEILAALRGLD